jgi:pantothenate kinase
MHWKIVADKLACYKQHFKYPQRKGTQMIIGICGFIGSGKDTIADYLVNLHHFVENHLHQH